MKQQAIFKKEMKLFITSVKNAADIILSNKKVTKDERLADVSFLEDQRGDKEIFMKLQNLTEI